MFRKKKEKEILNEKTNLHRGSGFVVLAQ